MAKNDVYIRSFSGAIFVAIVVYTSILGFTPLFTLSLFISTVCLFEFLKIQKSNAIFTQIFVYTSNAILLLSSSGLWEAFSRYTYLILAIVFLLYFTIELFRRGLDILDSLLNPVFGIIYISIPFMCFLLFSKGDGIDYNWQKPLLVFILVWASDTFAYVAGRLMGKTPLYPKLSPKKTIEGWIGGTLLAAAAGGIMAWFWPFVGLGSGIMLGVLVSIFGTTGDLFESALKRKANVKDSGKILPGHGGLLDRFDAFLFAAVIIFAWYSVINIR